MAKAALWFLLLVSAVSTVPSHAEKAMGRTMCMCPGKHKPLGSASSCEEACYGSRGGSGSSSGASSVGTEIGQALAPFIQQGIEDLFKGEDPAVRAQRLEQERLRAIEAARIQKEKDDRLDAQADTMLQLVGKSKIMDDDELLRDAVASPTPKPFPKPTLSRRDFAQQSDKRSGKPPTSLVACAENDTNQFLCSEMSCGGGTGQAACCPKSHPFLNHCDCLCYFSNYDITECPSYTACTHTWRAK